jgi:hypothetical protein
MNHHWPAVKTVAAVSFRPGKVGETIGELSAIVAEKRDRVRMGLEWDWNKRWR